MTQAQETQTNGDGKQAKVLTAVEAITKVTKILDQLSASDRKRVLTFVLNESHE